MKILVTGAAGFIGSHLCERLLDMGHNVVGLDCFTDYYALALKQLNATAVHRKGGSIVNLDLAEDELTAVFSDAEFIYHFAAQPGVSATTPYADYLHNNIIATHRLLESAKNVPTLKCFVNIATSSIYGKHATESEEAPPQPTSYYGVTKLAAEQAVLALQREVGFPACSLRLFSVCGPRERPEKLYPRLIGSILENKPFPLFEGSENHSRSYTYVGDIVDGLIAVFNQPEKTIGEIFNIGTEVELTTGEGIRIIEEILGKKAIIDIKPKRPGDQLRTCANITKARKILNYNPQTPLEKALEAEVGWYLDSIYENRDL